MSYVKKKSFILDYQKVMEHLDNVNFALSTLSAQEINVSVKIPKRFSISEQPDETITLLRRLYTIGKCDSVNKITFNHSECEFLGLSASTIMDIILLVVMEHREKTKEKLVLSGKLPNNPMVRDVLLASGLPYHINARFRSEYISEYDKAKESCKNKFTILTNYAIMVIRRCDHGRTNSHYDAIA